MTKTKKKKQTEKLYCPYCGRMAVLRPATVSYTHLDVYKRQELYGVGFTKEDLLIIADQFPDCAQKMEMGIGDMSIIRFYEKYKNEVPAVGRIMIWSKDKHLSCYQDNLSISRRREK